MSGDIWSARNLLVSTTVLWMVADTDPDLMWYCVSYSHMFSTAVVSLEKICGQVCKMDCFHCKYVKNVLWQNILSFTYSKFLSFITFWFWMKAKGFRHSLTSIIKFWFQMVDFHRSLLWKCASGMLWMDSKQ